MFGWRHAFGDATPESTLSFDGGSAFTVAGAPIERDALATEVELNIDIGGSATMGLSYLGQIGADAQDHGVQASLRIGF